MIFAGTTGTANGGVWKFHENFILNASGENENASGYNLFQNYPNPFNPVSVIRYSISENDFVILKIYDVLGNEVQTLVNKKQSAGNYSVEWNAAEYPGGIYFYKIQSGIFTSAKKMLLVK
jgi:hypothetical protein